MRRGKQLKKEAYLAGQATEDGSIAVVVETETKPNGFPDIYSAQVRVATKDDADLPRWPSWNFGADPQYPVTGKESVVEDLRQRLKAV